MDKEQNPLSRLMELAAPYKCKYVLSIVLAVLGVAAGLVPFFVVSKIVLLLMGGETTIFNFFFQLYNDVIQSIKAKSHIVKLAFPKTSIIRQTINFIFKTVFILFSGFAISYIYKIINYVNKFSSP